MSDSIFDLQSARNLFSKTQEVYFGFLHSEPLSGPFVILSFRQQDRKQLQEVLAQLPDVLAIEKLKLSLNENSGDFLSLSFLWETTGVIFSCTPDRYNKRELRDFRNHSIYGDTVKVFFLVFNERREEILKREDRGMAKSSIDSIYHNYSPA